MPRTHAVTYTETGVAARSTQVRGCTKLRSIANGQFKVSDDFSQKIPASAATFFKHDVGDLHMLITHGIVKMLTAIQTWPFSRKVPDIECNVQGWHND